ncbi:hypothetical protein KY363_04690, partial [Candidatus Woesearchaeota archaeon]|nr:hypothetical protein [Candidatus Woesearchaeota archaeon]
MGLDQLITEILAMPAIKPSISQISRHVDSPRFFDDFLRATGNPMSAYKSALYAAEGSLLGVISKRKREFKEFLAMHYVSLDNLPPDKALSTALGTEASQSALAKAIVQEGLMSPIMPQGHKLKMKGKCWYLTPEVVGEDIAKENLKAYIQSEYKTIDDINDDHNVVTVLGCEATLTSMISALIQSGSISPIIPPGHNVRYNSRYFAKEIVGEAQAEENIRRHIQENFPTLDDLPKSGCLATALGAKSENKKDLARQCIKNGIISPEMPEEHEPGKGRLLYFDATVVGEETSLANIRSYVLKRYSDLDALDIKAVTSLNKALNLEKMKISTLAKKLICLGFFGTEIPDFCESPGRITSWYLDADIVGDEQFKKNIFNYARAKYKSLNDIGQDQTIATALGLENYNKATVVKACVEHGIFSPEIGSFEKRTYNAYFNPDLVGSDNALENARKWLVYNYTSVDEIKMDATIAKLFGSRSLFDFRNEVLARGWLPSTKDGEKRKTRAYPLTAKFRMQEFPEELESRIQQEVELLGHHENGRVKQGVIKDWLRKIIYVFDSPEYIQLYSRGVPLTAYTFCHFKDRSTLYAARSALMVLLRKNKGFDAAGTSETEALRLLRKIRPDVYEARLQSMALDLATKKYVLQNAAEPSQEVRTATEGVFNSEKNYFRRKAKELALQIWLQHSIDFFDGEEYSRLRGLG